MKRNWLFLLFLLSFANAFGQIKSRSDKDCEGSFAGLPIEDQLKDTVPILHAGDIRSGETQRELMLRLFSGLPLPLHLPLNTDELIHLQTSLGESRPGIPAFWSSPLVLNQVLDLSGSFGPLSPIGFRLGPIGNSGLSPGEVWTKAVEAGLWHSAPRDLFAEFGPFNPYTGVFSKQKIGPDASDWFQGNFDVLGTNSFAGPKGILGPLGPLGAVPSVGDVVLDSSGFYFDQTTHKLIRTIVQPFGADQRAYEIINRLKDSFSQELSEKWLLPSGYMVDSHLTNDLSKQVFRSTAQESELLSAIVVPDLSVTTNNRPIFPFWFPPPFKRMNFDLRVLDAEGNEIKSSVLPNKVNLLQFQVRAGQRFQLEVSTQGKTLTRRPQNFRLILVPANSYYSMFVWMHELGPEFESLWNSNPKNIDLCLNYIFTKMLADSFGSYKSLVRSGQRVEKPVEFWRQTAKGAMDGYRQAAGANQLLLDGIERNLAQYRDAIENDPMTAEQFLGMWKNTMGTKGNGREAYFNLTPEEAAQIPVNWLNQQTKSLERLRDAYGGETAPKAR